MKTTKEFHIFPTDTNRLEYVVKVTKNEKTKTNLLEIFASNDDCWTEHTKGECLGKAVDHGDGFKILYPKPDPKNGYEYHELESIRILMNIDGYFYSGNNVPQKYMVIPVDVDKIII